MKEIQLCSRNDCTGCMACKQKCQFGAIDVVTVDGFDYPSINIEKCRQCGMCSSSCPIINLRRRTGNCHKIDTKCFAVWSKNVDIRMMSSSGGVFSVLAEYVISQGGIVFGAAWDDTMKLVHKGIVNVGQIGELRRSKYVQSDTANTFNEVKNKLRENQKVLFCGTPCQVAGLTSFLGDTNLDNLLTVDVLCQGVPSPHFFRKYIHEIENVTGWSVVDVNFRTKKYGWRCGLLLLLLLLRSPDGKKTRYIKRVLSNNEYYNSFIQEFFMRPSCYDCQFKCNHQGYYSDLTIADFWRIGKNVPFDVKDFSKGISAVLINTQKGSTAFYACENDIEVIERTWKEFATNGGLRSSHVPRNNKEAIEYLKNHSWRETQEKYFPMTWKRKIVHIAYLLLGEEIIRKIAKKII